MLPDPTLSELHIIYIYKFLKQGIKTVSVTVQLKTVSMSLEMPITMRSTPSLRSFPNVAFETDAKFV